MTERYKTFGQTTAAEAMDASETGFDVTSAAALRDSYTTGDTYRILVDSEVMIVTAEATNTLTVTRGAEGTTAATHSNGATVYQVVTSGALTQMKVDANLMGVTNAIATLDANFTITGSTGVFQDTGLSVTLPAAGTYLLLADVVGYIQGPVGSYCEVDAKLYNSTDAADASGVRAVCYAPAVTTAIAGATITKIITVAASKVIKLYANRTFTTGTPSALIVGNADHGQSSMAYFLLS